jgi:hypothetical protein
VWTACLMVPMFAQEVDWNLCHKLALAYEPPHCDYLTVDFEECESRNRMMSYPCRDAAHRWPDTLLACSGGALAVPSAGTALIDRADGGHLIVTPPIAVWDRCELPSDILMRWNCLVAATGGAMLKVVPALGDGCLNYWDAGNWSLHDDADPRGPKMPTAHRRVHLHVIGRSRTAAHPSWQWGEAPRFPSFADRRKWSTGFARLTPEECRAIVADVDLRLKETYGFSLDEICPTGLCPTCHYPVPEDHS